MKRTVRGLILALVGAGIAAVASPACVEYPQSLVVTGVVVGDTSSADNGGCLFEASNDTYYFDGTVDATVATSYVGTLRVENRMRDSANAAKGRVEANDLYILGATVRLTLPTGEPLATDPTKDGRSGNEFRTVSGGFVTAGDPGNVAVNLLDSAAICQISRQVQARIQGTDLRPQDQAAQVLAFVRVQAQTVGGLTVESQEFQFPINICWGCLVTLKLTNGECIPQASTATDGPKPVCRLGQDQSMDCTQCRSGSEYCRTGKLQVLPAQCAP